VLVGDVGALAAVLPSSFMSVLVDTSGVELILLGLNLRVLSTSSFSSEPVSVPSCESAREGPARGEERRGRGSRRGPCNGEGARYVVCLRAMGLRAGMEGLGTVACTVAERREAGTSGKMLRGI
jgi:hypothetical protein